MRRLAAMGQGAGRVLRGWHDAAEFAGAIAVGGAHEFRLDDIAEATQVMRERRGDPLKIVVVP